jgi:hypothetical protein
VYLETHCSGWGGSTSGATRSARAGCTAGSARMGTTLPCDLRVCRGRRGWLADPTDAQGGPW